MTPSTITELDTALDSDEPDDVLFAAWDALDVVGRLADALTSADGSHEVQALLTVGQCIEGRRLLPPPESGRPLETPVPDPGRTGLEPYSALLHRVDVALRRLASAPDFEDAEPLVTVARHASAAARLVMTIREDTGTP